MAGLVGKRRRVKRVTQRQVVLLSGAGAFAVGMAALTGDLRYLLEFVNWLLRTMVTLGASAV